MGQCQRPFKVEAPVGELLGDYPAHRRSESADFNADTVKERKIMGKRAKSPWLLHYDASSCNGCDIEVLACLTPLYDIERFGIINTGDPFQADILLITGGVNSQSESVVKQIYSQMPNPKVVVAVGICACTGGVFKDCYNIKGGVDTVIPVDIYVPGCAARPESIIDGVVKAVELLQKKQEAYSRSKKKGKSQS